MLLAWEALNIFLLTGISYINIFFIKKKTNVFFYSYIHDKFASTNITYNLENKRKKKKFKKDITQQVNNYQKPNHYISN